MGSSQFELIAITHIKMKLFLFVLVVVLVFNYSEGSRVRRDTTCAFGGRSFCNVKCKALGKASGDCAWNTETGAFDCECSKEERGIR